MRWLISLNCEHLSLFHTLCNIFITDSGDQAINRNTVWPVFQIRFSRQWQNSLLGFFICFAFFLLKGQRQWDTASRKHILLTKECWCLFPGRVMKWEPGRWVSRILFCEKLRGLWKQWFIYRQCNKRFNGYDCVCMDLNKQKEWLFVHWDESKSIYVSTF